MKLSLKIFLALVVASTVPLGAGALFAREEIRTRQQRSFAAQLDGITRALDSEFTRITRTDRLALARLCAKDLLIDRLLLDLASGRFGPDAEAELGSLLPEARQALDLDVLEVLDGRGRVLGSGHFAGRAGARDADLVELAQRGPSRPFVRTWRVRRESGGGRDVLALTGTCSASRGVAKVIVAGGRVVDDAFVSHFQIPGVATVVLAGPDGELPESVPAQLRDAPSRAFPLMDAREHRVATLVAIVSNAPLRSALAELDRTLLLALAAGVLGSWLFAFIAGRRLSRPLAALEETAARVAEGDFDATVGASAGGEVGRVVDAFNKMTADLRSIRERLLRAERIAAWRDIARRIAHEIKNPLFPIQTSIETMRKTYRTKHPDFDEIFEESTSTILEEVERMKRIVTEFSSFARMPKPRPEALAVAEIVEHVASMHQMDDVVAPRVTVSFGTRPIVRADRGQLTQVLVNLVQNAIDAAQERHPSGGGTVELVVAKADASASRPGRDGARIVVRDNGAGIPVDRRQRVFEPYFTTKGKGTGLGLAIVHRIVSDHGGTIEVASAPEGGTDMVVLLTADGPPIEADASLPEGESPLRGGR